jgi:uncharacterized protein (DUF111 family)
MNKIAYFQCPTGVSGDMCLGALVSLGVPVEYLVEKLNSLGIEQEYRLWAEFVHRQTQQATKVHVDLLDHHHEHDHHHIRHLPEIEEMILNGKLPGRAEAWSLAVFRRLAGAEGAVHGIAAEKVHFHEVGAVDAIVDIVGTCLGLDWLGIDSNQQGFPLLYCSAFPTGGGTVHAAHGRMAVPVPAVLKLWEMRGCPMTIKQVGLGAGSLDLPIPNILRLWFGESEFLQTDNSDFTEYSPNLEPITVLETQIDDLNPQVFGYVFEALFAAGAVDVFTQTIGMKKSRTGILLTVICHAEKLASCEAVLFRETSTLGIRRTTQQRSILQREMQKVETIYGTISVKVAWTGKAREKVITNVQPEYEDCAVLARQNNIPWREIHRLALESWYLKPPCHLLSSPINT